MMVRASAGGWVSRVLHPFTVLVKRADFDVSVSPLTLPLVFNERLAQSRHLKLRTIMVHNGVMSSANKTVRQSVSLPATTAAKVRSLAKTRRLSSNRMLVELIENGIEAEKRKQQEFFELAERFRDASDPEEAKRLGDELGRMVFGS
jgi:hypothetical protein